MFGRSHNSKNSGAGGGGGALGAHLFHRRLLPRPTAATSSRRAQDNHPQSVRKAADVSVSSPTAARHDAFDDPSPVKLVSVRRNAEELIGPSGNVQVAAGRRSKLGLSVAVVRGPSGATAMNSRSSSATSSLSADTVVHDQRDHDHDHRNSSDASASSHSVGDVQRTTEAGEC